MGSGLSRCRTMWLPMTFGNLTSARTAGTRAAHSTARVGFRNASRFMMHLSTRYCGLDRDTIPLSLADCINLLAGFAGRRYSGGRDSRIAKKGRRGSMATLERAIELAAHHHTGQHDKGGLPYILHPLRLMMACQSLNAKMVAVLHDTLEDTDLTEADLRREGFIEAVIAGVVAMTRRYDESYTDFVSRC